MAIYEHVKEFAGKPVKAWDEQQGIKHPAETIYRVGLSWEEAEAGLTWPDRFDRFLSDPAAGQVVGLVVGAWEETYEQGGSDMVIEAIVAASERLPRLGALFLGDITMEESEISWIVQSDVAPLFNAYPRLEHFCVRGAQGLTLGSLRHDRLRSLIVQSGGLPVELVRQALAAELPDLEHLELWLGDDSYGASTTPADLEPLLAGRLFPRLRYLGLRDSHIADELAVALATAPILERIEVLDLSLGTLGDEGAEALLRNPALARLKKLDIHHHYCTKEMIKRLKSLPIEVDLSEVEEADDEDDRYVAVSE